MDTFSLIGSRDNVYSLLLQHLIIVFRFFNDDRVSQLAEANREIGLRY